MEHLHKVRQNIQWTKVVTSIETMRENKNKNDPSKEYLPPAKIKNRDHSEIWGPQENDLKWPNSSASTHISNKTKQIHYDNGRQQYKTNTSNRNQTKEEGTLEYMIHYHV